jgi:hypothetical protein
MLAQSERLDDHGSRSRTGRSSIALVGHGSPDDAPAARLWRMGHLVDIDRLRLRLAGAADGEGIARLHADSWRRHYRGIYSDTFLDGDLESDRRAVWDQRLQEPDGSAATIVAEDDVSLLGFVHVVFDDDPTWGALVDNIHVVFDIKRRGIGTRLMACAADAVSERYPLPQEVSLVGSTDRHSSCVTCGPTPPCFCSVLSRAHEASWGPARTSQSASPLERRIAQTTLVCAGFSIFASASRGRPRPPLLPFLLEIARFRRGRGFVSGPG